VKDTVHHVHKEKQISILPLLRNLFWDTTFRHKSLSSVTQAGLVNNLNDGMIWGLLPLLLFAKNFDNAQIGILTAVYPTAWGVSQLATGKMSDYFSKKLLLFWGTLLQAQGIIALIWAQTFLHFAVIGFVLGIGTALVYPTFLAAIAEYTNPTQRAESLGVFRFWRDLGYAVGAILTGVTADLLGMNFSILLIGILTAISGLVVLVRMQPPRKPADSGNLSIGKKVVFEKAGI
jgi:MFS family permease